MTRYMIKFHVKGSHQTSLVFFWSLYCLSDFDLRLLITPLISPSSSFLGMYIIYAYLLMVFSPVYELEEYRPPTENRPFG